MKLLKAALKGLGLIVLAVLAYHAVFAMIDVGFLPKSGDDVPRWVRDLGENFEARLLMMPLPPRPEAAAPPAVPAVLAKNGTPEPKQPPIVPPLLEPIPANPALKPQLPQNLPQFSARLNVEPTQLDDYLVHLPKDYRLRTPPKLFEKGEPAPIKEFAFVHTPAPDVVPCNISFHLSKNLLGPAETLDDLAAFLVKGRKDESARALVGPIEKKDVNGIPFRAFAWSGDNPKGHHMTGITFAGLDGATSVVIHCQSIAHPHIGPLMRDAEASIATFRRKPNPE